MQHSEYNNCPFCCVLCPICAFRPPPISLNLQRINLQLESHKAILSLQLWFHTFNNINLVLYHEKNQLSSKS